MQVWGCSRARDIFRTPGNVGIVPDNPLRFQWFVLLMSQLQSHVCMLVGAARLQCSEAAHNQKVEGERSLQKRRCLRRVNNFRLALLSSCLRNANPPTPYSIQKRPELQICPKFVPAIVFEDSAQDDWNMSNICDNLKKQKG